MFMKGYLFLKCCQTTTRTVVDCKWKNNRFTSLQDNLKKFREEAKKLDESEALQKAREKYVS